MRYPIEERSSARHGVALVTTVIVIAVLAMVAVAFMQSTSLDRLSSRSVANYYRAVLAAEAGLAAAEAQLATNTANDTFIVVANTNRELFVGNGVSNSLNFSYAPLFSTAGSPAAVPVKIQTNRVPLVNVPSGEVFTFTMPGGLNITSPPVAWTYLTNDLGQTNARFAYWVEDLSGKVDLSVVGALGAAAKRPTGTNPAEIALWSIFNPSAASEVNNAQVAAILAARNKGSLLTPASSRFAASAVTSNTLADVAVGLRYDTNEPDLIPFGFGYADQGKPKFNLNTNLTAAAIASIPDIINRNLPRFGTRGGAMSPSEYLQNIAANIIDYADVDTNPTTGGGDPPTYRGVEAIAWPNEVFTRIELMDVSETEDGDGYDFSVGVQHMVEVWNLSSKEVEAGDNSFIFDDLNIPLKVGNWDGNLSTVDPQNPPGNTEFVDSVSLAPNSYGLIKTDVRVFKFVVPKTLAGGGTPDLELIPDPNSRLMYKFEVNGIVVDAVTDGRSLGEGEASLSIGESYFISHASAYGTERGSEPNLAGGDPRGQLFMTTQPQEFEWSETTPGGRNSFPNMVGEAGVVDPHLSWPDGGHSSSSDIVGRPSGRSFDGLKAKAGDPDHWLQKAGDAGRFERVSELGFIFDPIQWEDTQNSPYFGTDSAAWTNFLANAPSVAPYEGACGRNTLRVGRAEHQLFNTNGKRASQLLDLFTTAPANNIQGRININTASTNVLRALAAGVVHTSDKALQPGGSSFAPSAAMVSAFVAGVTNFRSANAFYSPAQISTIATNTNSSEWPASAVFGNANLAGTTVRWNDAAAEEWFAKVYPLTTVRSRNFMVHAVGQSLDVTTGAVISMSTKLSQIYLDAERNAGDQKIKSSTPVLIRSWEL